MVIGHSVGAHIVRPLPICGAKHFPGKREIYAKLHGRTLFAPTLLRAYRTGVPIRRLRLQ